MSKISIKSIADIDQQRKRLSDLLKVNGISEADYATSIAELDDIESLLRD